MASQVRIGTRGSPLALAQASIVRDGLIASGLAGPGEIETVVIKTSGDRIQDRSLADIGGKGLFTKEIEEALLAKRIDLAVHSLKDLPAWMPDGLVLAGVLKRADPRDALLSPSAATLAALPEGARVGTSSPRRRALLLHRRPDLTIVEMRGNVGTRLAKLEAGEADATLLAVAGLSRLGLTVPHAPLDPSEMLPAGGQGAIGVEIRADDPVAARLCAALTDADTASALEAERAFLAALDGSCRTPIAALATIEGSEVVLDGLVAHPEGEAVIRKVMRMPRRQAGMLGTGLARAIKAEMPPNFFEAAGLPNE